MEWITEATQKDVPGPLHASRFATLSIHVNIPEILNMQGFLVISIVKMFYSWYGMKALLRTLVHMIILQGSRRLSLIALENEIS